MTDLEISRAWLVDPAAGREGPGEIVVVDGALEAVTWLEGAEADGIDDRGVVVAPGFIDLHVHLREPGNEDAETVASGLAAAAHGGFTTVCAMPNTTPALDEPGVLARIQAAGVASGSPVELLAHGAVTVGRDGRDAGRPRRARRRGGRRVQRRRRAGRVGVDPAVGDGLRRRARPADRRPSRGDRTDRGRRGERRVRGHGPRVARLAGRGRGGGRGPGPRGPRRCRPRRAGCPAPPDPRLVRRCARPDPPREGRRPAGHVRRDAPSPGAHRRMGRGRATLGLGRDAATRGATTRCAPARTTPRSGSTRRSGRPRTRRPCWPRWPTARPTPSPPTMRPTPRWTRPSSSGPRPTASAASRRRWACSSRPSTPDRLPLARAIEALTTGPSRVLAGRSRRNGSVGLVEGAPADLVVFDRSDSWLVTAEGLSSRGKNSPLLGRELPGRVLVTIAGGRLAYEAPDA